MMSSTSTHSDEFLHKLSILKRTTESVLAQTQPEAKIQDTISYFDLFSPRSQSFIKRLMGLGVSIYIARIIFTSPEFKFGLSKLISWKTPIAAGSLPLVRPNSICLQDPSRSSLLLDLPGKLRRQIWSILPFDTLKNIRLVCKHFQWDIDYIIGIKAFIDDHNSRKSINWYKSVAIRSCTIHHLKDMTNWDFLCKPKILTTLKMNDLSVITPEILGIILKKCSNLNNLNVHFHEDGIPSDVLNRMIFECFNGSNDRRAFIPILLDVTHIPAYRTCRWIIKFEKPKKEVDTKEDLEIIGRSKTQPCSRFKFPTNTKYIHLNFEQYSGLDGMDYSKNRFFWKSYLEAQVNLKIFRCNFGPICWDVYGQIIRRNYQTIEKITLGNVACWDTWNVYQDCEAPFDWNFFSLCEKLAHLSIEGENGPRFGPAFCIPLKPCSMNLHILHCNFGLTFWEIYTSIIAINSNTLESVTLLRITNWDQTNSKETIFDWNVFSQCGNLKNLTIGGEHHTFLQTINFESVFSKNLKTFQLYWISLTILDVWSLIEMDLENGFEFLDWCSIDGVYRSGTIDEILERCRKMQAYDWKNSMEKIKEIFMSLPLFDLIGTIWLVQA